ncbi:CACTA en-spm transposon protein [Cucumis melo var. makuwa]|uniref:CACTA en-spm transposon protein n=1 Tax=Cucumis melo var. makuwa TaxID=1194695 RepID=A0A5D3CX68_CUCMM|nr:CACTA en-spm transposon protein [Cucumis melo var. makuwa]
MKELVVGSLMKKAYVVSNLRVGVLRCSHGHIPMTIAPGVEKLISLHAVHFNQAIDMLNTFKEFWDDCHRYFKKYSDPDEARANPPNLLVGRDDD